MDGVRRLVKRESKTNNGVSRMSWAAFWIVLDGELGEEDWTFMASIWQA